MEQTKGMIMREAKVYAISRVSLIKIPQLFMLSVLVAWYFLKSDFFSYFSHHLWWMWNFCRAFCIGSDIDIRVLKGYGVSYLNPHLDFKESKVCYPLYLLVCVGFVCFCLWGELRLAERLCENPSFLFTPTHITLSSSYIKACWILVVLSVTKADIYSFFERTSSPVLFVS